MDAYISEDLKILANSTDKTQSSEAQFRLGNRYIKSDSESSKDAADWYRKAAI